MECYTGKLYCSVHYCAVGVNGEICFLLDVSCNSSVNSHFVC